MARSARTLAILFLLSACSGGGGGGTPDGGGTAPETVAAWCDQFWTTYAARWAACDRGSAAYYAAWYAPAPRCADPVQAVAAGRAVYDRARAAACLDFLETGSCDAIEAHVRGRSPQADCRAAVAGQLGSNALCYSRESCASDVCLGSPGSCPSTCYAPHAAGSSCSDGLPCGPGLHCEQLDLATIQTCQPLEAQGGRCMSDHDCAPGLRCDYSFGGFCQPRQTSGSCSDDDDCAVAYRCRSGSCVLPQAPGESCTQGLNECGAGLWCDGTRCADGPGPAQACTILNNERRPCIGATCASSTGVCVAWTEGATCTLSAQCAPTMTCSALSQCTTLCAEP